MSELGKRTIVGIALIIVAMGALWAGGIAFWALTAAACIIMIGEWAHLTGASAHHRWAQYAICIPLGIMAPIAAGPGFLVVGLLFAAALFLMTISRNWALGAGALYVGLPIMALLWMRGLEGGLLLAFWALATVWATDIGAYFAGRSIGGPKIAPKISPNKTWAGLFGGMLGALALGWVLMRWAGLPRELALFGPVLAVFAQAGDFFESWMKRRAGVKDSGTLLPGHGGALDRLDGAVTSLPIAALLVFGVMTQLPPKMGQGLSPEKVMVPSCMLGPDGQVLPDGKWQDACRVPQK